LTCRCPTFVTETTWPIRRTRSYKLLFTSFRVAIVTNVLP